MKTNNLTELLKKGNVVIPSFLISNYKDLGLNSEEFIFLLGLINEGEIFIYDPKVIGNNMNIKKNDVLELVDKLNSNNLIEIKIKKNKQNKMEEYISLVPFYEKLSFMMVGEITTDKDNNKKVDNSVYERFEKEFGRPLSPMEYEIITGWLNDNFKEEIVLEALKEATYNGVSNLRYIDKILYEWQKRGLDTVDKIEKNKSKYKKDKSKKVELFDYNWLEDEEK